MSRGTYIVTDPPATMPITLAQARQWLNFTEDDPTTDDDLIEFLIATARQAAEGTFNRSVADAQEIEHTLSGFPCVEPGRNDFAEIRCFLPPLIEVTEISYYDADNAAQTVELADVIFTPGDRASICPAVGKQWPATAARPDAVKVTYICGYNLLEIPKEILLFMRVNVCDWYANREDGVREKTTLSQKIAQASGLIMRTY
jgi:uncharacterized phiE125 gp8 family phage protein